MGRRTVQILLAAICVAAVGGAVLADATTPRASSRTLAKRKLAKEGYTSLTLKCSSTGAGTRKVRTTCSWTGMHELSRCSGKVLVKGRKKGGRTTRIAGLECKPLLIGFNTFTNDLTVRLQRSVGATVRRMIVPWSLVEPAPGVWNWERFDKQYKTAIESGLRPLLIATEAPCWARPLTGCLASAVSGPPDPMHDGDWRDYIRRIADRYPKALGIEIWNEPNLRAVFWPQPDPVRYTSLLTQAYQVVKSIHPDMPVVSGGLLAHGVSGESFGGMGDVTFLRGMLAAGAADSMDAISVHPYPQDTVAKGADSHWVPNAAAKTLAALRSVEAEFHIAKPFWITEVGESTTTQPGYPAAVTPAQQAKDLQEIIENAAHSRDIDVVVIHTLGDVPRDAVQEGVANVLQPTTGISVFYSGVNSGFGVFDSKNRPKPAACALSKLLGGTLDC